MVHGMTTSDNEWQRVVQQMTTCGTTSDNEWKRITTSDKSSDNECQQKTIIDNDNKWQWVTTNDREWYNKWKRMRANKIDWL